MIKIAVDVMGMDNGSKVAVDAILQFLSKHDDVSVTAFGKEEELEALKDKCEIVNCTDVMEMEDGALAVLRKKESSMIKAVSYAKDNDLDGVVSGGSTGAFLTASTIYFKVIEGIDRAALLVPFPTLIKDKTVAILDLGASSDNTPKHLLDFARMGRLYVKVYNEIETPKVYLLSNGAEEKKGSELVKEAHQLIKESNVPGFIGNIEARDVMSGEADVIVTGGFAGNILLKSMEGTAKAMSGMIKGAFKKNIFTKLAYLIVRPGMKDMKEKMNYKKYGGAMLVGLNKIAVKAHGSSDAFAFYNALEVCYKLAKKDMVNKIKEEMK